MKKLLYANYVCLIFLLLLTLTGFHQVRLFYSKYGFSYTVTTIIEGEETTKTVTLYENLFASGLMFIFFLVLMLDTIHLKGSMKTKKETENGTTR